MPEKQQIENLFNSIAPSYDKLNHIMSFGIDRVWRRKAVRAIVDSKKPLRVLDVATGTGDLAIAIARRLHPQSHITGVDLSEQMLKEGREKVMKMQDICLLVESCDTGCPGQDSVSSQDNAMPKVNDTGLGNEKVFVSLQQGDVEHLAYQDASFDRVSVAFGIRNFEHLERGFSEMCRVLKKGGKLVILELSYPDNPVLLWFYKLYALHFLPFVGGLVSGQKKAYTYLPKSILAFPKADTIVPLLQKVGFSEVAVHQLTFETCVLYIAEK